MISPRYHRARGYTLIEMVVAVGLFALVMVLAAGAYLLMIDLNRRAEGTSTGIDSLSFALETMMRSIRTGSTYSCGAYGAGDCLGGGSNFSFKDVNGADITFARGTQDTDGTIGAIVENGSTVLTDPSVNIDKLTFYVIGTGTVAEGDFSQPHVTIVVSGSVTSGPSKTPQPFAIETGSTLRGVDLTVTSAAAPAPPVCTLTADPVSVLDGGSAILSWTTVNASTFRIDPGVGISTPVKQGSRPTATLHLPTTYTGTATNAAGTGTCSVTVLVTP